MRKNVETDWCIAAVAIIVLIGWSISSGTLAYLYALHLESQWNPAGPQAKKELEKYLSLYSTREIKPVESMWGKYYKLKHDERMIQYLILWDAPLDVVYDDGDNIKALFTSYE